MKGAPLDINVRTSLVRPCLAASSRRFPRSTKDIVNQTEITKRTSYYTALMDRHIVLDLEIYHDAVKQSITLI